MSGVWYKIFLILLSYTKNVFFTRERVLCYGGHKHVQASLWSTLSESSIDFCIVHIHPSALVLNWIIASRWKHMNWYRLAYSSVYGSSLKLDGV